jgi:hypothetical protein
MSIQCRRIIFSKNFNCNVTEINGRGNPLRWPRDTLYQQKLALTSPTRGGRPVGIVCLRTKSHGVLVVWFYRLSPSHYAWPWTWRSEMFALNPTVGLCCVWFTNPLLCWLWCSEVGTNSTDWAQLSRFFTWARKQESSLQAVILYKKTGRWIMSWKSIIA